MFAAGGVALGFFTATSIRTLFRWLNVPICSYRLLSSAFLPLMSLVNRLLTVHRSEHGFLGSRALGYERHRFRNKSP
ncbi:hypothetical protein FA15DRAFT_499199 [Coprinopsis marcescibilis]|uniref:Uncharacterized protein n=1 Tax=Coprinopsis marcescibilis TaxID=230819 RepID=A0A5C3KSI7_COPMA|nr:hypothetical protein FA15DRAFT_499199 [Coprinopsis marcescibilis]